MEGKVGDTPPWTSPASQLYSYSLDFPFHFPPGPDPSSQLVQACPELRE